MQIRTGFEITYDCPQPTPMLLALSVHPSRLPDVIGPHRAGVDCRWRLGGRREVEGAPAE